MDVLLFDFFGTLVDYSPSRVDQGYARSHALIRRLGGELGYVAFLERWSELSARFDAISDIDDHEFSMHDLGHVFLADALRRSPTDQEVDDFVATYLAEWNTGVQAIAGVPALLAALAGEHRLAVVTC